MITQVQADTARVFHREGIPQRRCDGARGPEKWRRNGKTKRWKRDPERFSIPVKWGMYDYAHIIPQTAGLYHAEEDCPAR